MAYATLFLSSHITTNQKPNAIEKNIVKKILSSVLAFENQVITIAASTRITLNNFIILN
jgi:hypothetical protein